MRYLGIDYGTRRIGIAISDEEGRFAFPKELLTNQGLEKSVNHICSVIESEQVEELVIGHSANFRGEDNPVMRSVRTFADALKRTCAKPIHLEPEFFTSIQASRITGGTENLDAQAAAIILQSFLDKMNS